MPDDRDAVIAQLEAELRQSRLDVASLRASLSEGEAREEALAEILRITVASPGDAQPVLEAVVQAAARLSACPRAMLAIREGEHLRIKASFGQLGSSVEPGDLYILRPGSVSARALRERRTLHTPDQSDPALLAEYPDHRNPTGLRLHGSMCRSCSRANPLGS